MNVTSGDAMNVTSGDAMKATMNNGQRTPSDCETTATTIDEQRAPLNYGTKVNACADQK